MRSPAGTAPATSVPIPRSRGDRTSRRTAASGAASPDIRALARQAFRDTAGALQPVLARELSAPGLLRQVVAALVALACTEAGRALALCPLESLSSRDVTYVRRFRLLAREMVKLALTRAAGSGHLKRCDCGLLARALVNDADFLGRALAHVDERRARDSASYVFEARLRAYLSPAGAAVR